MIGQKSYVTPILREAAPGSLAFCGSAVLLKGSNSSRWLVSAAHVMAEMEHSRLVVAADASNYFYIVAHGSIVSTCDLTPENAAHDAVDLSFLRLIPAVADQLLETGFDFLPVSDTDTRGDLDIERPCVLSGYPRSFVEITDGRLVGMRKFHGESVLLPNDKVRLRHGLKSRVHLVSPFRDWRDEKGLLVRAPDPDGMSGGAVWSIWEDKPRLAGIIIEHDSHRREIVATRIAPLIRELLRREVEEP